jgi:acetolactate synthase-1/2/3 large subunit
MEPGNGYIESTDASAPGETVTCTGGDALAGQLVAEGVEVIFGLPGDQLMHALESLAGSGIPFVVTRHEQATTYMADGYARATGTPGVAMVVPGVGVYNAGSGLATAYACSSPVLLLAGQVPTAAIGRDLGALHDVHDQLDLVRPVTKRAERVTEVGRVPGAVRDSFRAMRTGRPRPTEVEIPPDVFGGRGDVSFLTPDDPGPVAASDEAVEAAADVLAGAERPLVVCGGGVVLGDASAALRAVVEHLQAAVVDTREGKGGFDSRHPLFAGTAWNNKRLRHVIDDADVILAVGSRYQAMGVAPGQRLVHIDVDPDQIGRNAPADVAVAGDARRTLEALLAALDRRFPRRASRAGVVGAMRDRTEAALRSVGPQAAMIDALRAGMPDDALVVADTTTVAYMSHMLLPVFEPRSYFSTSYMGTLGFGYPAALGVKYGRPDRPVVTITGDGGFLFAATEMATAVQHGIHTVTVLFDDGAYGNSNRDQRENYAGKEYGTLLRNPDWVQFAGSFGVEAEVVPQVDRLADAVRAACAGDRSVLIVHPMDRLPSVF